jgi:hypothetical protein
VVSRHVISAVRRGWSQDKWKNERTEKDSDVRKLDKNLRQELLAMLAEDLSVREELAADGSLFEGYHPIMEAVHRKNAARLAEFIG